MMTIAPERLSRCRVLVVGDAMLDRYWMGEVERISPEAPVPVVRVNEIEERLGGAANVARNVVAIGAQAGLLAVLGDDEAGRSIGRLVRTANIRAHLHTDDRLPTTVKLRVIGRRQQILRVDFESTPEAEVLAAHLDEFAAVLPDYDAVLLSDYGKGGLTHISRMIDLARSARKPILVDPKGTDYTRYANATILTPNRAELTEVIGRWSSEADLTQRAKRLCDDLNLDALLLTRSEEGMTLFGKGEPWSVPAQAREVFDVSGAGDTVIAVLAAMLAAGIEMHEAIRIANRAGGIVVGKFGTATASYDELFAGGA
jgi:D-glycero-beta-D-manno-heptose-7-phosphate kinase